MKSTARASLVAGLIAAACCLAWIPATAPAKPNRCSNGSLDVVRHQAHRAAYGFSCKFFLQEFTAHGSRAIQSRAISKDISCKPRSSSAFHCDVVDAQGTPSSLPFGQQVNGLLSSKARVCGQHPLRVRIDAIGADSPQPTGTRLQGSITLKADC